MSAEELLCVWEKSGSAHPIERALAILDAAWPEIGLASWARASVGKRDGCLLALYESLFGRELHTTARCSHCSERLESTLLTSDIRVRAPTLPLSAASADSAPSKRLEERGFVVDYRLPSSEDLLVVTRAQLSADAAVRALLVRCVLAVREGERELTPASLPEAIVEQLSTRMAEDDPDAEIRLHLGCPSCGEMWSGCFDIVSHLWAELDEWAQRILCDVHALARAYGWSERDIINMSPQRRALYLGMVSA